MNVSKGIARAFAGVALWSMIMSGISGTAAATDVDPPIDVTEARIFWRWIGVRIDVDSPCPAAEGWNASPLFALQANPLPPGLARYCLYELPPGVRVSGALVNALRALVPARLTSVQPDLMAVAAEGGELEARLWPLLAPHFLEEAGQPVAPVFPGPDLVRLALIDTHPTYDSRPERDDGVRSPHGFSLVNMAYALLCDGSGDCAARLTSRLALPYTCFDRLRNRPNCRDEVNGGWFGSLSGMAVAIREEVADWLADSPPMPPPAAQTHLVLNISAGWDERYGGPQGFGALPIATAAVYSALEDASCRGALVFAAAGNEHGGPNEATGPIYPAGWEVRAAPPRPRCAALLEGGAYLPYYAFPPPGQPDTRPLVHAVGGVRADGGPIHNARRDAEPARTAFADHALAESVPTPGKPTATLTGTSTGTLVASAAAAAGWRYANGLRTYELVELMQDSGERLGRAADFCLGGNAGTPCPAPAPEVSRVSVCATVDCASGTTCEAPFPSCPTRAGLDLSAVFLDDFRPTVDLTTLTRRLSDAVCDPIETLYDPASPPPVNPCLTQQYHGVNARPQTDPAPGDLPCPNCVTRFASPGTLFYEIDPSLPGTFTDATLLCGDTAYALALGPLVPGDRGAITNVECPGDGPIQLLLRDADGSSQISPVLYLD